MAHNSSVKRSILLGCIGIKLATEIFEATVYLIRTTPLSPLKEGVFGKVRDTILRGQFVATTSIDNKGAVRNAATYLAVDASNTVRECICLKLLH